jgi:DNA-binding CsgD family transcriptional regulator
MGTGLIMPAWRMTGRAAELAQLDAAIGAGGAGGVVLAGTAGAGRTRLLREALHRASRDGRDVLQIAATRCTAAIPFGAVASLLPPGGPAAGPPWELLRRATDHLVRPTAQPPLVVGADDVHLLDPESAALLHHLVLHGAVFLLAAVRAGEPAPDAVAALWKDGLAGRLTVHPLPAAAIDDLLVQALGTAVQDGARQHIQWVTSGSPLLLRELLAGALDEGALVRQETGWGWKDQPYYGAALVEVVDGWLAALGDGSRTVLEVVACAEPLPAELLNELADRGALDPAAVETAERLGVISCGYSGSRQVMRPAHPIYGEVIRATLPRGKAQRIAGWLAGAGAGLGAGTRHRTGTPRPAPAAVPAVDGLPLTRREHEIALLATSGLTSKAIAASLQLSVRTVNNHLARTYAKAGISCRAELAAIMTRTAMAGSPAATAGLPAAPHGPAAPPAGLPAEGAA